MRGLFEQVERIAVSSIPVLVTGETGTGKEVIARAIHDRGPRRGRPLCCVNCGAIPSQLVESTLFGHEKGAFTGAGNQHKGVFETADGGTVLLDEIGELPPGAQAALLRVLESKRFTRVGGAAELEVDVRVIAATHRDLDAMAAAGTFRRDLLYRLNAMTLAIPPLRERRGEIPPLAERFLGETAAENTRQMRGIDTTAMALLCSYDWPGNVRELRNVIERAVVLSRDPVITPNDLPDRLRALTEPIASPHPRDETGPIARLDTEESGATAAALRERVRDFEAAEILAALESAGWNQTLAAQKLQLPLRTLVHKIKQLGIKKGYRR
jgi:DNA-binding NtrC family response regulator